MGYFKLALSTTIIKTSNEKISFGRSETQKCMTSGLISKVNSSFSSYTLHCFFPFNFFFKYVCTYYTQMYMLLCSMPKLVKKYQHTHTAKQYVTRSPRSSQTAFLTSSVHVIKIRHTLSALTTLTVISSRVLCLVQRRIQSGRD